MEDNVKKRLTYIKKVFDKKYIKQIKIKKKLKVIILLWVLSKENNTKSGFIYRYGLNLWIENRI